MACHMQGDFGVKNSFRRISATKFVLSNVLIKHLSALIYADEKYS